MLDIVRKVIDRSRREGITTVLRQALPFVYNRYLRHRLPSQTVAFNGVHVPANHWFDSVAPFANNFPDRPTYEAVLIQSLTKHANPGEKVVIVGGGWGVSAVTAAKQVGETGEVVVYEGSQEYMEYVEQTIRINDVTDIVSVRNRVVSHAVALRGDEGEAPQLAPEALPDCDVLELDCEGAELEILQSLDVTPRIIIVETHAVYNSPETAVRYELEDLGYEVINRGIEDEENGVYVLTVSRSNKDTTEE